MDSRIEAIRDRYRALRARNGAQDARNQQIRAIREGRVSEVAPDLFPMTGPWQQPIVANMIDVAARDLAEMVAPLPSITCTSPSMSSERARDRATRRTKVALGYISHSDLQKQLFSAADHYITYGKVPIRVDIDYAGGMPAIRCLDPLGTYADEDRQGRLIQFFQRVSVDRDELLRRFPEKSAAIERATGNWNQNSYEVVLHHDAHADTVLLHAGDATAELLTVPNPIGRPLVTMVKRPGVTDIPRGSFDDLVFVHLAKARFAMLAMQSAHEAVNAPLVVPSDVAAIPHGPGATIRTANPAGVGRVPLNVPADAYRQQQVLDQEMRMGSRFPEARTGNVDASIVTGKGVSALMSGYNSQIRGHQAMWATALTEVVGTCFEVDELVFAGYEKTLRGTINGTPYTIKYEPSAVINGDHTVDVTYGLMAGLDPNQALVFGLQARAEKLISRDLLRRNLPMELDPDQEQQKVDLEDLEESAKQAIQGLAQSIPALAASGQDPSQPMMALAEVIRQRQRGTPMSEAVANVFAPPPPPEPTPEELMAQAAMAGAEAGTAQAAAETGQLPPGLGPEGTVTGVPPGMAGTNPGGRPDLQLLLAGIDTGGRANMQAGVSRMRAV